MEFMFSSKYISCDSASDLFLTELINKTEFNKHHKVMHHVQCIKHTEYQQIFQTTVTDHSNVHAVYPTSIFYMKRQNCLSQVQTPYPYSTFSQTIPTTIIITVSLMWNYAHAFYVSQQFSTFTHHSDMLLPSVIAEISTYSECYTIWISKKGSFTMNSSAQQLTCTELLC